MTKTKWYVKAIHLLTALALVLCFGLVVVPQAAASPDQAAFHSTADDGDVDASNQTYSGVHDASSGHAGNDTQYLWVGQQYWGTPIFEFDISRGALFFDTSSLPDDAIISSAGLSLYGYLDLSEVDFDITVVDGCHEPLQDDDYGTLGSHNVSGGSFNTSGWNTSGYNDIPLNETGMGWISKTGITKLGLRSSKDITATPPSGPETVQERVDFCAFEEGPGFWPRLVVTYTTPVGGEAYPIDKTGVLALWIGLAVLLAGGMSWYALRRRSAHS